jgi:hypothetical protein
MLQKLIDINTDVARIAWEVWLLSAAIMSGLLTGTLACWQVGMYLASTEAFATMLAKSSCILTWGALWVLMICALIEAIYQHTSHLFRKADRVST